FDLSVPAFIVAGALFVTQGKSHFNLPFGVALLIALLVAAFLGGLARQICQRFNTQPLIVTLAPGTIVVGLTVVTTSGGASYTPGGSAPTWLTKITSPSSRTFGVDIPPVVAIFALAVVVMTAFLYRTGPGRRILATGANM